MKIGLIGGGDIFLNPEKSKNIYSDLEIINDNILLVKYDKLTIYHMKRHGIDKHSISSEFVDYKENIKIFNALGVDYLIGITAVGSLSNQFNIGDVVLPDQLIDFTRNREESFNTVERFQHVSMKNPFSSKIRETFNNINDINFGGTIVTIEGPHFSTAAESKMYELLGGDLINMTTAPEAKLAREIGLEYQPLALVTDKDSEEDDLSLELIINNIDTYAKNRIKEVVLDWLKQL